MIQDLRLTSFSVSSVVNKKVVQEVEQTNILDKYQGLLDTLNSVYLQRDFVLSRAVRSSEPLFPSSLPSLKLNNEWDFMIFNYYSYSYSCENNYLPKAGTVMI